MLHLGSIQVPYSLVSLVTLTVQNSALTILLHYVSGVLSVCRRVARWAEACIVHE